MFERDGEDCNAVCEVMFKRLMELPFPASGMIIIGPFIILFICKIWFNAASTLPPQVPSGRAIPLFIGLYLTLTIFGLSENSGFSYFLKIMLPVLVLSIGMATLIGIWERGYFESKGYSTSSSDQNPIKALLLPTFRK